MYQAFEAYVQRCISISEEEMAFYASLLELQELPKKHHLLMAGDVCEFEAYIIKGCVRSYFIDSEGAEINLHFAVEDWWIGDPVSFYEQQPSRMFIETLEPTSLLVMKKADKDILLQKVPQLERMFRIMILRSLGAMQNRLFDTMAKPAHERYEDFLKKYPDIPQRVPQHHIASYLGISAEFLSKIRKRKA